VQQFFSTATVEMEKTKHYLPVQQDERGIPYIDITAQYSLAVLDFCPQLMNTSQEVMNEVVNWSYQNIRYLLNRHACSIEYYPFEVMEDGTGRIVGKTKTGSVRSVDTEGCVTVYERGLVPVAFYQIASIVTHDFKWDLRKQAQLYLNKRNEIGIC
jgi:hypothetical protein